MNPQPANPYPDAHIDRVLEALRATAPPTGLEQRIAARLAQAAETCTKSAPARASYTTVILNAVQDRCSSPSPAKLYTGAALLLIITLATFTLHHNRTSTNTAQTASDIGAPSRVPHLRDGIIVAKVGIAPSATAIPSFEGAGLQPRHQGLTHPAALAAKEISPARPASAQQPDPDAIALAETLAPSHPAPPMPLTAQEHLMLAVSRPGQPIQLAELDLARAPFLRAEAKAREEASIGRYVKSLLFPFALADALSPTTDSQPQEASTPAPPPSK